MLGIHGARVAFVTSVCAFLLANLACSGAGSAPGSSDAPRLTTAEIMLGHCVQRQSKTRCGVISGEGEWLLGPDYEKVPWHPEGSFWVHRPGQKVSIVDTTGDSWVVTDTDFVGEATRVTEGVLGVFPGPAKEGRLLVDLRGEAVTGQRFSKLGAPAPVHGRGLFGTLGPTEFSFVGGLAPACTAQACGWIRPDGTFVRQASSPGAYHEGWAFDGSLLVDAAGKPLVDWPRWSAGTAMSEGRVLVQRQEREDADRGPWGPWFLVGASGEVIAELGDQLAEDMLPFAEGRAVVHHLDRGLAFLDIDGTLHWAPAEAGVVDQLSEGLALYGASKDGPLGYLGPDGKAVIEPGFAGPDTAAQSEWMRFHEGLAAARDAAAPDGGWGFIDTTGRWVIQPQYTVVSSFHRGYARVKDDRGMKWLRPDGSTLVVKP